MFRHHLLPFAVCALNWLFSALATSLAPASPAPTSDAA